MLNKLPIIIWSGKGVDGDNTRIVATNSVEVGVEVQDTDLMEQPRWVEVNSPEPVIYALKQLALVVSKEMWNKTQDHIPQDQRTFQ